MGSFRITALAIQSQSGITGCAINSSGVPATDANILLILNQLSPVNPGTFIATTGAPAAGTIRLIPDSRNIFLDGAASPTPESNLPIGFRAYAATLTTQVAEGGDLSTTRSLVVGATVGTEGSSTLAYPSTPPLSLNSILATTFGMNWQTTATSDIAIYILRITGFYDIMTWSWEIANGVELPDGTKLFDPEEIIEITSEDIYSPGNPPGNPTGTGPCLDIVTEIVFSWTDPVTGFETITVAALDFNEQTCFTISFPLPETLPEDIPITVTPKSPNFPPIEPPEGTGTEFDGSVLLGPIIILNTLTSGLYKIVADKTDDTMYIDSPNSDDTVEIAIPDPFGKTGFIGG
jgi:hypothetical protein